MTLNLPYKNLFKPSTFYAILKFMTKRFSIHFALIFLFAFAQIGAITHEISHVEYLVKHSQQEPSNQDQSQQDKKYT